MASSHPLSKIVVPVRRYLDRQLGAHELVRIVDDLVGQDFLFGLEPQAVRIIDQLHESLALYIPDEKTRQEEPGIYIGESELREKVKAFDDAIRSMYPQALFDEPAST